MVLNLNFFLYLFCFGLKIFLFRICLSVWGFLCDIGSKKFIYLWVCECFLFEYYLLLIFLGLKLLSYFPVILYFSRHQIILFFLMNFRIDVPMLHIFWKHLLLRVIHLKYYDCMYMIRLQYENFLHVRIRLCR